MMNPFNWFGKGAQERKKKNRQSVVQKKGNSYVFSKSNSLSISGILSAPFATAHVASISLAAMARAYIGLLCGGTVGCFIIYSIYQDYKDDNELMQSLPENEE